MAVGSFWKTYTNRSKTIKGKIKRSYLLDDGLMQYHKLLALYGTQCDLLENVQVQTDNSLKIQILLQNKQRRDVLLSCFHLNGQIFKLSTTSWAYWLPLSNHYYTCNFIYSGKNKLELEHKTLKPPCMA